ncbi:MAG: PDZ domain-containing protein, partial [Candidatus Zixiibacteriota bacterium]
MKKLIAVAVTVLLAISASAQQTYYTLFKFNSFIPAVTINDRSVPLQAAVYADLYKTRSSETDMKWVTENDSDLVTFWKKKGDTLLHILTELAGIEWREAEFDIYLVRYFPTVGSPDPLIIPIGGIGPKGLLEEAPQDNRLILNVAFQLARRLLAQAERSEEPTSYALTRHPLMRPTPFRRDNMAMLLALVSCQNMLGYDKANEAFESDFWDRHFPARLVFKNYLMNKWVLRPEKSLSSQILNEPRNSALVEATRPPRPPRPGSTDGQPITQIAGISPVGKLGFSVRYESGNAMVIDTIDSRRLAYANGFRPGDQIRRVGGQMVRTFRDVVEKLLSGLE